MIRDENDLLRRHALAQALTDAGYPTASATLATKATRGGGPPFRLYGRIPLYRWGDALAWAESRLSALQRSTSEGKASVVCKQAADIERHMEAHLRGAREAGR